MLRTTGRLSSALATSLLVHEPEIASLEVVGTRITPSLPTAPVDQSARVLEAASSVASILARNVMQSGSREAIPAGASTDALPTEMVLQPGPHLEIVGTDSDGEGGARVCVHTGVGTASSAELVLVNRGSTALIVSWRKVEESNPLGKLEDMAQRFFFDHRTVTVSDHALWLDVNRSCLHKTF